MIHTPAHKQTEPEKRPGQIKTLGDYIQQVQEQENPKKKLTFEEWFNEFIPLVNRTRGEEWNNAGYSRQNIKMIWDAAQENK